MASHILILLNFMNIANAEVFLLRRRRMMYCRQHVMVIGRNKRPVERTVEVVRLTVAKTSLL